jgi:DnaJ-class molecular chaperone
VYRLLASRYHPDNIETGNSEMFIRLSEAYRILSDPERRASYDARRRGASRISWSAAELRKRSDGGENQRGQHTAGSLGGWAAALQRL